MKRRNSLELTKEVYELLKRKKELSINAIAKELKTEWKTTLNCLKLLHHIGIVKERRKHKIPVDERLFSLIKK
jgi:Mn-dependent DtxR family transcriptional regulator